MSDILEEARGYRKIIEKVVTNGLSDEDIVKYSNFFPFWDSDSVIYYGKNDPNGNAQSKVRSSGSGLLYFCIQTHTSQVGWDPENTPALWAILDDPDIEYPDWRQPMGADDAYGENAKVTHNGKRWINIHGAGNVWEPGVYGWKEVE